MMVDPPKVDERATEEVESQVRWLLARSVEGGWPERPSGDPADALIGVFAHYCETVIDRLNRAPGKNLLAFLDMLGASTLPAQPARVPLTFHLAAQHTGHAKVPALTQIAAAPEKGEQQPVIFETESELVVAAAQLGALAVMEGSEDRFGDYSSILTQPALKPPAQDGVPLFHGSQLMRHELHIDLGLPSPPPLLQQLRLSFQLEPPAQPFGQSWLQWEIWDAKKCAATLLKPVLDETQELSKSGDIVFESLPAIAQTEVDGSKGYWLRCRTVLPVVSETRIPLIRNIIVGFESARQNLAGDAAFVNAAAVDLTKDFFPFGQHPRFGDTLYLASAEAFAKPGATVTMHFVLTNPASGGTNMPLAPVAARSVHLAWELWDGTQWRVLGGSESVREVQDEPAGFADSTKAFTESGTVTFRVPPVVGLRSIANQKNYWVRVRIVGGNYGREAYYAKDDFTPASFSPPSIGSISLEYHLLTTLPAPRMFTFNDFTFAEMHPQTSPFRPFKPILEAPAFCYFGFASGRSFSDRSMSIYLGVANPPDRKTMLDMSVSAQRTLIWEYWNGSEWTKWTVVDDTESFRRSGVIRFLAPRDFALSREFGKEHHWLRVHTTGGAGYEPRLRLALLNTTMASQSVSMASEILGSSNGKPGQSFHTTKSPVLLGQQLEILEPATPPARVQRVIHEEEGDDAIRRADPDDIRGGEVWVRWHEVPNFNASGPRDCHYVIERMTGEVRFGDDLNGRIPPALPRNIVMARYQVGGGAAGNRKVHTIEQMKSAIPYIDKVTNAERAAGGTDAESLDSLLDRAPRQLRHGYRAVTAQDFEDLAMLASPGVARARCVPLYDLAEDPDAKLRRPGVVSLIIAPVAVGPASSPTQFAARPIPSMELIGRVRSYLDAHRLTEADLVIVGPDYVAIEVGAEITVSDVDIASEVELAVARAVSRFLHPTIGSYGGSGWQFGQEPNKSDLYALIEGVPGVDHVRELRLTRVEERPGGYKTGYFLICGAEPKITATLEK